MQIPTNHFKRRLRENQLQIGLWVQLVSPLAAEVVATAGFDWLVIDGEHAPNELTTVLSQLQAVPPGSAHPIVRMPWNDMVTIKRYLDIGVQTLLIPQVETAEQARNAVAYTRYPPKGVRGYAAGTRANLFGRVKDYAEVCENELCVIVQIETRPGAQNLEEIAAVEGIDGLFIGPGDLAAALGYVGQLKHPDNVAAIEDLIARARACGKPIGILTPDEAFARRCIALGCSFVAVGSDLGLLARGAEQLAAKFTRG